MSKIKNQTPNQCATWQSSIQNIERIQNIKSSKVEQLKFQQLKILIQQINKQQKTQQLHIYFVQYILKQEFFFSKVYNFLLIRLFANRNSTRSTWRTLTDYVKHHFKLNLFGAPICVDLYKKFTSIFQLKTMFECACGFTSGTAEAFLKHISRYQDEGDKNHYIVNGKQSSLEEQIRKEGITNVSAEVISLSSLNKKDPKIQKEGDKQQGVDDDETLTTKSDDAELLSQPSSPSAILGETYQHQQLDSGGTSTSDSSSLGRRVSVSGAFQWTVDAVKAVAVRASGSLITGGQQEHSSQEVQGEWPNGTKVQELEDLLLWKDTGSSLRILLLGLYFIIFGRSLLHVGFEFMQPSSFICILLFLWLLFSTVRKFRAGWRESIPQPEDLHNSLSYQFGRVLDFVGSWSAAAVTLAYMRAIQGNFASRLILLFLIWSLVFVGEVQLLSQELTFALLYISIFVLPFWYVKSKQEVDYLANQLADVSKALARQNFKSVILMCVGSVIIGFLIPYNLVTQICVGILAFFIMMAVGIYMKMGLDKKGDAKIVNGGYVYLDHRDTTE
eukprot:TRINITY_DN3714_c0_g2_i4.p1 TRINITY_DN3714_c0_g2~~TRINITY_DN3714_c0_g2_i4.p1  ORF type:complete len:558 (+),score=55.75 TRINITY_DN3714_c0_g2_i4:1023-2696(+)